MNSFRVLLLTILVVVLVYTGFVVAQHGINLFPVFFGDITRMGWAGQFNLDFMGFLMLSAFWLAWRHEFSATGLALGFLGFFLGAPFLCAYFLLAIRSTDGDVQALLLGPSRARG